MIPDSGNRHALKAAVYCSTAKTTRQEPNKVKKYRIEGYHLNRHTLDWPISQVAQVKI